MNPDMGPSDLCKILGKSVAGSLIKRAGILILDEIAMMSKIDLERIEHSLRLLMGNGHPFGGKLVVLSGDFRQILPVERNPMDSINTCLKQSFLWQEKIIQPMSLTINERVRQFGGHDSYGN